jgi:phosphoenolpyruvate-protein phosphotransferase
MASLKIMAPFDGWCDSLDAVPDAAFSGRMLGEGVSLDPTTNLVRAPFDGTIITLPQTGHAVAIRSTEGLELLIHIGIDTVTLQGRGFSPKVRPGDQVRLGDALIAFDFDMLARGAKSLITPIVVTSEDCTVVQRFGPGSILAGRPLFEVKFTAASSAVADAASSQTSRGRIAMPLHQGLHARPAALLAQRARAFSSTVTVTAHGRSASARSIVSLMALGARQGDDVEITAVGPDAERALAAVLAGIEEALSTESAVTALDPPLAARPAAAAQPGTISGITAVAGFAAGRATRLERREIEVVKTGRGISHEGAELDRALQEVRRRLERLSATGDGTRRAIIAAHLEFLDDPALQEGARREIEAGYSAGYAWRTAIRQFIAALQSLTDARLRERADDLLDVEAHVLLALANEARPMTLPLPDQAILIAQDLLPSELTALDRRKLIGICLAAGGATSHVAILAAGMEIPMLVNMGDVLDVVLDGDPVIIDADHGVLNAKPTHGEMDAARASSHRRAAEAIATRLAAQEVCRAADGTRIEVFANVGNAADAAAAVLRGAEGCGLLRTEFLFIDRDTAPPEDEQLSAYQAIADALGERPLILRLMDVGGDKPLRYLPLPPEENPALGLRGIRTALRRPDILRTQLRAALRVRPFGRVRLLIPMVTDAAEVRTVRALVEELSHELSWPKAVELGAMIETPAAALSASWLLQEVDFLSIGSNDLTQYTLAMDRGHSELAGRTDALHPAVLKLIAATATNALNAGKLVAVCGGVAADRLAAPILIGLGVRELSVVPSAIPDLKCQIRTFRIEACRELAARCLDMESAAAVRELAEHTLQSWEVTS